MSDVHDVLVRARNLIDDPEHWTNEKDKITYGGGYPMCAVVALSNAGNCDFMAIDPALVVLARAAGVYEEGCEGHTITFAVQDWNDASDHARVKSGFDAAINATAPVPSLDFLASVTVAAEAMS